MNYQNEISVYLHIGFLAVMVIVVSYIGYKLVREAILEDKDKTNIVNKIFNDEEYIEWNNDKHK